VPVPVIANGDIVCADTAARALARSGADGVMVGRGARGRPWLLAQIAARVFGTPAAAIPQGGALVDMVAGHYQAMLGFYGTALGARAARKHLGWYMDEAGTPADLRAMVLTERRPERVLRALPRALGGAVGCAA